VIRGIRIKYPSALFLADGRTDRNDEAVKSFAILRTRLKMGM